MVTTLVSTECIAISKTNRTLLFKKQQWIHTALRNTRFRTNDMSTCFVSVWDTLFHESFVFRVQEVEAKPDFFRKFTIFQRLYLGAQEELEAVAT